MGTKESGDKRLLERRVSRGELSGAEYSSKFEDLPDLADEIAPKDPEETAAFGESLAIEKQLRDERIERILNDPDEPTPPPAVPIIPFEPEI